MLFSEKLKLLRGKENLTQEELSEKLNVSRQAITKWEKNESLPDVYMISKLANMFDVSIEELIYSRELGILEKELERVCKKVLGATMFNFTCLMNNAYRDNETKC